MGFLTNRFKKEDTPALKTKDTTKVTSKSDWKKVPEVSGLRKGFLFRIIENSDGTVKAETRVLDCKGSDHATNLETGAGSSKNFSLYYEYIINFESKEKAEEELINKLYSAHQWRNGRKVKVYD